MDKTIIWIRKTKPFYIYFIISVLQTNIFSMFTQKETVPPNSSRANETIVSTKKLKKLDIETVHVMLNRTLKIGALTKKWWQNNWSGFFFILLYQLSPVSHASFCQNCKTWLILFICFVFPGTSAWFLKSFTITSFFSHLKEAHRNCFFKGMFGSSNQPRRKRSTH